MIVGFHRVLLHLMAGFVCVAACSVLITSNCAAQDAQAQPTKLSLADAVSRALGTNTNIIQAESSLLTSESRLRIANLTTSYGLGARTGFSRSSVDSSLSSRAFYSVSFEDWTGTSAAVELAPFGLGDERGNINLSVRRPLLSGKGANSKKADLLAGAKCDLSIQDKQVYLTRQATVLGVVRAYYSAVLARDQVKVQENAVKVSEEVTEGARKRAKAGLVPEIEVSRAEIRVAQTKDQLNLRRQTAQAAEDQLMTAIGVGIGEKIELTDSVPESSIEIPSLVDAVKAALGNRAELSMFDEQLLDQVRQMEITKDALKPKLDVVAGFSSSNDDDGLLSVNLLKIGSFRAGVEYVFPLDKRIDKENSQNAERTLDVLRKMRTYRMEEIVEQVRSAYRSVETSRTSVEILSQNVLVAQDNLRLAQRMVDEGLDDNRNILDAQESLTQAENGLLAAKIELHIAAINLKHAMGEDLTYMGSI